MFNVRPALTLFLVLASSAAIGAPSIGHILVTSPDDFDATDSAPNHICTLREAVNNAANQSQWSTDCASGGTSLTIISFAIDRVTLNPAFGEISVNSAINLQGPATVSGPAVGARSRLLHVTAGGNLLTDRISLENGNADKASGGAILNEGTLTMLFGTVQNNRADRGGALALYGDTSLYNVEFFADTAKLEGGAVWIASTPAIGVRLASFHGNQTTDGPGSAIFGALGNADITIDQSDFFANRASGSYGDGTVDIGGTVHILHSVFAHNVIEGKNGGAGLVLSNGAIATLEDDEFRENRIDSFNTTASGGAIHAEGGIIHIEQSNIVGNQAWIGGGIYAAPGTVMSVSNTTVAKNIADSAGIPSRSEAGNGAALYADDAQLGLFNVTVKDNIGRAQLTSHGANASVRLANTVAWAPKKTLNCSGSGLFDTTDAEAFQNIDSAGGSCPAVVIVDSESQTFEPEATFTDPVGPPSLPLEHLFWRPVSSGHLARAGDLELCEDPDLVGSKDELGDPRPSCDIGAIETQ